MPSVVEIQNVGHTVYWIMDGNTIREWTACEEEFRATANENPFGKMEVLAKSFPANSTQQLSGQDHFDAFGDMLCHEIGVEPSIYGATSDLSDWYKLLGGETHDPILGPLFELPFNQPSKHMLVEVQGNQVTVQKPHRISTIKKRRVWSTKEHRQFLYGIQHFGRGEWKAISMYYVPSRTPAQLASHAQKYFQKIEKNHLYVKKQRYCINDVKLISHNGNSTELCCTQLEKVKSTELSIPQPMPIEDMNFLDDMSSLDDMNFLDDLVQGMPTFRQTSNSATNVAGQMPLNNGIMGSLQWEALSTHLTKEHPSVLLDQTGGMSAETRTGPFYGQRLDISNQIYKDNLLLPAVFNAHNPPQVLHYEQGGYNPTYFPSVMPPSNQYNVHPTMQFPF